jgi:glycine/D-amino acid oxidase-like deaminating enzyme
MTADVVVIGAGVVGAAIADTLAPHLRVTIIESDFAGAGSTGAAMGHIVVMDDSLAQLRLCHLSRLRWQELFNELPIDAEPVRTGTLWLAASDEELDAARAKVDVFRGEGVAAELLDERQLREAEPAVRAGLVGALRVVDDLVCYPPAIARALVDRAIENGATVKRGRVVGLEGDGVRMADGSQISCGHTVVAAGAQSAAIVPGLPVVPRRGHLVITDRQAIRVTHQLVELGYLHSAHTMGGASVAFNVQPRRTGQLLIGSSRELVGFDRAINRPLVGRMLQRAVEFVPGLREVPLSRTWVGYRPATPDSLPLIGAWPERENTWIATGHEGLGITMAPATAALTAASILGEDPPLDPSPYRPDRALPGMSK